MDRDKKTKRLAIRLLMLVLCVIFLTSTASAEYQRIQYTYNFDAVTTARWTPVPDVFSHLASLDGASLGLDTTIVPTVLL